MVRLFIKIMCFIISLAAMLLILALPESVGILTESCQMFEIP